MNDAEKAYQYFVITVPENEEQAKAYFWARKSLQPTLTPPNEPLTMEQLRELVEADRDGRCPISPKLICIDEVTTPTPEQYRWMMGRFLKGEQDG